MLHQIVPGNAQATMLRPKASRNEMVAWLIINGAQARNGNLAEQLDESKSGTVYSFLNDVAVKANI